MSFEVKKIGESPKQREFKFSFSRNNLFSFKEKIKKIKLKHFIILIPVLILSFYLIISSIFKIYDYSSKNTFLKNILTPVLSELEKDENGFLNFLLIGKGGEGHDGPELTDTMIVVSIDVDKKNIIMLSIPRDLWVETQKFGASRINELSRNIKHSLETQFGIDSESASEEATKILIKEVEKIVTLKIPYYATIDFEGFKDIVDAFGGLEINVEKDIYDGTYPNKNWGFEVFSIKKGTHTLDGETTLKYVRSRHGNSDFDRAERQQQVVNALKEKAKSLGLMTSPRKIKNLFNAIRDNFKTNLDTSELITLAFLGSEIGKSSIVSTVLNNDWNTRGGFLGTPPRSNYGGASVLIPYSGIGNYSHIHVFTNLLFKHRDIQFSSFEVLNGTMNSGLATKAAQRLERYGIPVMSIGNTPKGEDYSKSEIWVYSDESSLSKALPLINKIFPVKIVNKIGIYEESDVTATFIIGSDYK